MYALTKANWIVERFLHECVFMCAVLRCISTMLQQWNGNAGRHLLIRSLIQTYPHKHIYFAGLHFDFARA